MQTVGGNTLTGTFPHYPLEAQLKQGSDRDVPVTQYADFIAETSGRRSFPWRILAIARKDTDLLTNQLVFQIAEEQQITDTSWIRPGKVSWDWWNADSLYGVDFRAGINTRTRKYYIDFASSLGLEHIILDQGWYKLGDLLAPVPEINVPELVEHGKQKNVRMQYVATLQIATTAGSPGCTPAIAVPILVPQRYRRQRQISASCGGGSVG